MLSRRRRWPAPRALLIAPAVIALTACSGAPSPLAPSSPEATNIAGLFWGLLVIATLIFVLTEGLLIVALFRFRSGRRQGEPRQVHGNARLEVAWTLAPAVIVAGIFVATVSSMNFLAQPQPGSMPVKVIGHQWWWEIQYPALGITTATDLHVPVGQPIEVALTSADVIHSFWPPELAGKMDVIPGRTNVLRFTASNAGEFRGLCAEFCGTQHANMGFLVVAEPRERFDSWVTQTQARASIPAIGPAARGAQIVTAGVCAACHTVDGTAAQGKVGPNLTHFASRKTIAALTLENTASNLAKWLGSPQAVKPGNKMPANLGLSREALDDVLAFLIGLQ